MLKSLLGNALVGAASASGIGDVNVTALPPDRLTTGADERTQVNIFMYRVAPFSGLAPKQLAVAPKTISQVKASSKPDSATLGQHNESPLLLELSYLLTACGAEEFHSEILLGSAMQILHDTPIMTTEKVRAALESLSPRKAKGQAHPVKAALSASELAEQVQQIKITPQFLSFEDMSKLWSALQARYRPSVCYQVSAVVIGHADYRSRTAGISV